MRVTTSKKRDVAIDGPTTLRVESSGGAHRVRIGPRLKWRGRAVALALVWSLVFVTVLTLLALNVVGAIDAFESAEDAGRLLVAVLVFSASIALGLRFTRRLLRALFSTETLDLGVRRWELTRALLGRRCVRAVDPGRVASVRLLSDRVVVLSRSRPLELGAAGTEADRRWLHGFLRALVSTSRHEQVGAASLRSSVDDVPSGFVADERFDSIIMERGPLSRLRRLAPIVLLCVTWNGVFLTALAVLLVARLRGEIGVERVELLDPGGAAWWYFVAPWLVVGLGTLVGLLSAAFERTRYRVAPGSIQVERVGLRQRDTTKFERGALVLCVVAIAQGRRVSWLHMLSVRGERGRVETLFQDRSAERVEEIASWISRRSGFPVLISRPRVTGV